jgi:hypothetical protein
MAVYSTVESLSGRASLPLALLLNYVELRRTIMGATPDFLSDPPR